METIPLSKGAVTIIDSEDLVRVQKHKWHCTSHGYAQTNVGGRKNHKHIYLHHFILGVAPSKLILVDHINRNKLDNRKCNLRLVIPHLNRLNSPAKGCVSYRGVSIATGKRKNKYYSTINGKSIGYFPNPRWAAMAYDIAAKELYGVNAFRNFPDSLP